MMEEMPAVKADNIIIAEEFLNEMIDDEEKQQHEPYISLPRVKRQMHDSFSGLSRQLSARSINHNSRSNNNNGSFTCSPTPTTFLRSQSSSGSVLQNLWQKGFGGSTDHPQPSNLMDTHLARLSYESTPMGEGRLIGQTKHSSGMGMEDVYLDEPSRRGIRMMKRGGVSKPFRDNTRSRKTKQRTALFIMLFVGFLLAGMGVYAITRFVRSSREHDNNNSAPAATPDLEVEVPELVVPGSDNNAADNTANDGDLLEAEAMALEAVKHMEEEEEENPAEAAALEQQKSPATPQQEEANTPEEAPPLFRDEEHQPENVNAVEEVVSAEEVEVERTFNDNDNMDSQEEDVVDSIEDEDEEEEDVAEVDLEGEDTVDTHEDTHAALVEQEFDEELTTVQKEAEVVHEEMEFAHDPNQIDLLEKEEDALQSLEEVVAEEKEVFEEEQEALNSEDYALLKQEEINLNHQEDNVAEQANLMGDMAFASGAEVDEKTQEEEALQKVESGLQEDQQDILRQEARVEGWDYDKAKKEADHLKEKQEELATIEARRADEPQPKEEEEEETLQDEGEDGQ